MFFLRCAISLAIVYSCILCSVAPLHGPRDLASAIAGETTDVAGAVVARANDWCAGHPVQCFRDAARLNALVQSTASEPISASEEIVVAKADMPRAPMPVPAPRRRAARAVLTDAR